MKSQEFNGLVAQQYAEIKHKIKSLYDNNHGKVIEDIEKEMNYLQGELAGTNQLLSHFRNKNSTCFLQRDAIPRKATEESNENIFLLTHHGRASLSH